MIHISFWKKAFIFIVLFFGFLFALPNFLSDESLKNLPDFFPKHRFNLGLDLKGGSQLLLEVELNKGIEDRMSGLADDIRKKLRRSNIGYADMKAKGDEVLFVIRHVEKQAQVFKIIKEIDPQLVVAYEPTTQIFKISLSIERLKERKLMMLNQTREIIQRRIDAYGTAEPTILLQGEDRILVQLPGVKEPGRVKELLGTTAKMTFHLVPSQAYENGDYSGPDTIKLPVRVREAGGEQNVTLAIEKNPLLGGENLINAQPTTSHESGQWEVAFELDSVGASKFAEITRNNVGRRFAIVLDNQIITAPVINGAIPGGRGVIQGRFDTEAAHDLALLMRSGALPAPLKIIEERVVGPDLGQDSIQSGQRATIISVLMVGGFMILAYMVLGVIANIGLVANLILLLAGLSVLGATLTLPGIAGIALTLGMAVDANVLIYERIREELRLGRKIQQAIDSGYNRAMTTIVDSNVTTLLAAAVLFYYGSGPIQGFAVTLTLGIIISMFTAISVTRVIIAGWINWRKPKTLEL